MASTRQEIIDELKQLLEQENADIKEQVDRLKTKFYSVEENVEEPEEEARAAEEEAFKALLAEYKARRAEAAAAQAKEQTDNLTRKQAILEQMKTMVEGANADGVMDNLQRMKELQAEWKTIGAVPRKYSDELWKQFTEACDAFFNARREVAEKAKSERQTQRQSSRREPASGTNLFRLRDTLIQEIKIAENNILFFSGKSKTANKIVEDMQRKIDKLKAQLAEVKERIKAADEE